MIAPPFRRAFFSAGDLSGHASSRLWSEDLAALLHRCDGHPQLLTPSHFAERIGILDWLEVIIDNAASSESVEGETSLLVRARALADRFELANTMLFANLRGQMQRGDGLAALCPWIEQVTQFDIPHGLSYDWCDDLVAGILQLQEPDDPPTHPGGEMVFYQPTPARHIFETLQVLELGPDDVLIDLGSGLGHVPLLAAIATPAQCIGIEREPAYIACARAAALEFGLSNVDFMEDTVLNADLSCGTVFYLYTPFTGSLLDTVLNRLQRQAAERSVRVAAFGPCVDALSTREWLTAHTLTNPDRVAIFSSAPLPTTPKAHSRPPA